MEQAGISERQVQEWINLLRQAKAITDDPVKMSAIRDYLRILVLELRTLLDAERE